MKAITSHEGVMLEIEYDPDPTLGIAGPTINIVRVLDSNYKATGPNLVEFLDKMFMLVNEKEGTKFLSVVAEELA